MKLKIVSFIFLIFSLICFVKPTFAANDTAISAAYYLHELGLLNGTGVDANGNPNFELDRVITRNEAITMLVRILGKEQEAQKMVWDTPFTDVADWARPYVGYAYNNNLTKGTSAITFGGNDTVTASQYITFILRILGYSSDTDFEWNVAWKLSDSLGLTAGQYSSGNPLFLRGDVVQISLNALLIAQKDSTQTLAEQLFDSGFFTEEQYNIIKNIIAGMKNNQNIANQM